MERDIQNREFLGQGLSFPLQIGQQGGIALAKGSQEIEQSILIVLSTSPGERKMRPDFGCRIKELVFAPDNATTRRLAAYYVEEALDRWEPRIELLDVEVAPPPDEPNALLIRVEYRIRTTNNLFNLVYPFYLERSVA